MQRYFIQLSYDGTAYHGWQTQLNANSVQETMEKVFSVVSREKIELTGAGRTDAGVHARFYVAHFDTEHPTMDSEKVRFNLNCLLPHDIAIQSVYKVPNDAHARFGATYREYQYHFIDWKDPFLYKYSEKESRPLDLQEMNRASAKLFHYHDFTSFSKLGSDVKTNNCKIFKAEWEENERGLIFTIRADRFLRNMVRAIVGTLIEVGLSKLTVDDFCKIIDSKDRSAAGASVSAKGLFLVDIGYPDEMSVGLIRKNS